MKYTKWRLNDFTAYGYTHPSTKAIAAPSSPSFRGPPSATPTRKRSPSKLASVSPARLGVEVEVILTRKLKSFSLTKYTGYCQRDFTALGYARHE